MPLISNVVVISGDVRQSLEKAPHYILDKFEMWIRSVEEDGLEEAQKLSGFCDAPYGKKEEIQRVIQLGDGYRAIYVVNENGVIKVAAILGDKKNDNS